MVVLLLTVYFGSLVFFFYRFIKHINKPKYISESVVLLVSTGPLAYIIGFFNESMRFPLVLLSVMILFLYLIYLLVKKKGIF